MLTESLDILAGPALFILRKCLPLVHEITKNFGGVDINIYIYIYMTRFGKTCLYTRKFFSNLLIKA